LQFDKPLSQGDDSNRTPVKVMAPQFCRLNLLFLKT